MDEHSFPQDWATGLQEQVDWNDAGAFAHLADHPNLRGYVAEGFRFDPDFGNDLLDISAGKAFLFETETLTNDHRADNGPDEKTLRGSLFVAQRDVLVDQTLVPGDVNYVFIHINQDENDLVQYQMNTTGTAPPEPYLLLGRVDTETETYVEENRAPATDNRRLRVTGDTHGGDF